MLLLKITVSSECCNYGLDVFLNNGFCLKYVGDKCNSISKAKCYQGPTAKFKPLPHSIHIIYNWELMPKLLSSVAIESATNDYFPLDVTAQ